MLEANEYVMKLQRKVGKEKENIKEIAVCEQCAEVFLQTIRPTIGKQLKEEERCSK